MPVLGAPQQAAVAELTEWWEDLWQQGLGPTIVLVRVPPRWGRSTILDQLTEIVSAAEDPATIVFRINGRELPEGPVLQAQALRDLLMNPATHSRAAELLGVDKPAAGVQLGLGAAGLLVSGVAAVAVLLASVAVGVAGKLWEDSPARPRGAAARAARSVAEISRSVPAVVLIDDAECLDAELVAVLLEGLAFWADGHMLAVVAVDPDSSLAVTLTKGDKFALAGMVYTADADPDMDYQPRVRLARELSPGLPDAAVRRIGERTQTFAEVFTVASAQILAELPDEDLPSILAAVDAVVDAGLVREPPTAQAVMVAWAEGPVHSRQMTRAVATWEPQASDQDADLVRSGSLVRLADPSSPRLKAAASALAPTIRRAMATAVLDEALGICADPLIPVVDRIVAGQAAHRVRRYLDEHKRGRLVHVQREVVSALEEVGDFAAATAVTDDALAEYQADGQHQVRDELAAAKLRLARTSPRPQDPLVAELVAEALSSGAAIGLEARVWAAINLLHMPGRREAALKLTNQVTEELEGSCDLGSSAAWRLALAFHAGRAEYPTVIQRLLAPLLSSDDISLQDAASAVLRTGGGPQADTRLQIAMLEADLQAEPSDDDNLRLHNALARAYEMVGDYRSALNAAQQEVRLRQRLQGYDHPATLTARRNCALLTGKAGDAEAARNQLAELLPEYERVFGPDHQETLFTQHDRALWTGSAGQPTQARDQFAQLLPDFVRTFGPHHPETLAVRQNHAIYTGQAGDRAGARDQLAALLPDYARVFGPRHPQTLMARFNHATRTGEAGDPAGARDQLAALLPDYEREVGPGHPQTLRARVRFAFYTGEAGDAVGARDQLAALLPDLEQVLGPGHPDTFEARLHLAYFAWKLQGGSGGQ